MIAIPIIISLLLYLIPPMLFRRDQYQFSRDYLVSTSGAPDGVFQNSSLAYALQLATFGPFFAWGVLGDWIPGVLNACFFCLGLSLLYFGRHQIGNFLKGALSADHSITIHEFLAQAHGNSPWIRLVASGLTLVALWGIVMSEMFGLATALGPLMGIGSGGTYLLVISLFLLMFAYSATGGNDGVMRSDQIQLGFGYFGMYAAVVGMIFMLMQSTPNGSTPGAGAIAFFGLFGATWLIIRRGRFIDSVSFPSSVGTRAWRIYLSIERVVNGVVVLTIGTMVGSAIYYFSVSGPMTALPSILRSATAQTSMSGLALFSLALLPLGYQIVDITNWQRFAAAGEPSNYGDGPGRRALLIYVFEAPLAWISLVAFGSLAAAVFRQLKQAPNPFGEFALNLISLGTLGGAFIAAAFLLAVFAIGLSTMDAVFSATQCAFQYDILPGLATKGTPEMSPRQKVRATRLFGLTTYLVVIGLFYLAEKYLTFGRDNYLALLLAFYSAQIAFIPLVAGAFLARRQGRNMTPVEPGFAIASLLGGTLVGIGSTLSALVFGPNDVLLWGAIPECLLVSTIIYAIGWFRAQKQRDRSAARQ